MGRVESGPVEFFYTRDQCDAASSCRWPVLLPWALQGPGQSTLLGPADFHDLPSPRLPAFSRNFPHYYTSASTHDLCDGREETCLTENIQRGPGVVGRGVTGALPDTVRSGLSWACRWMASPSCRLSWALLARYLVGLDCTTASSCVTAPTPTQLPWCGRETEGPSPL